MHPSGLTLRQLAVMANGKAEMLGMTNATPNKSQVLPYDPVAVERLLRGM